MSDAQSQNDVTPPQRPMFQFSLRTLLLLFVVLASSLAVFGAWGIIVFALVLGLAAYLHHAESFSPLIHLVLALVCLLALFALLMPSVESHREAPPRVMCQNNLKLIVLALCDYEKAHGCFPPAYIADKNGKPMHSWRTLILPYMDCDPLYKLYDFNEPWDGPKNIKLLALRPPFYACPSDPGANSPGAQQTNYFAVVGPNTAWAGEHPRKFADFSNKASDTIMLVEAANTGVGWTEPRDCSCDSLRATAEALAVSDISSHHGHPANFFFTYDRCAAGNVAFADGHVSYVSFEGRSPENVRKMLLVGGCTDEAMDSFQDVSVSEPHLNWPNIAALAVWIVSVGTLLTCAVRKKKTLAGLIRDAEQSR